MLRKEGTTQLCRTSKLSINTKNEDNYCMSKPEKIRRGLGFDPGAAYIQTVTRGKLYDKLVKSQNIS